MNKEKFYKSSCRGACQLILRVLYDMSGKMVFSDSLPQMLSVCFCEIRHVL